MSYPRVGLEDAVVRANADQDAALEFEDWNQVHVDDGRVVSMLKQNPKKFKTYFS